MTSLKSVEDFGLRLHKKLPVHLPVEWRRWLAQHSWWLVAIGAALTIISVLNLLQSVLRFGHPGYLDTVWRVGLSSSYTTTLVVSAWIAIITSAIVAAMQIAAIQDLRQRKKKGWNMLLAAMIVGIIGRLVSGFVGGSVFGVVISAAIAAAIGGFLLLEIRPEFVAKKSAEKASPAKE